MPITIREIALTAGVSRGTVDRVINDRGKVKPDVAERIRRVMDEMGYTPNKAGKVLATRKNPIKIGCFLPSVGNSFFDDVIRGFETAESEFMDFGLSVEIKTVRGYDASEHVSAIQQLVDNGCQALCVSTIDVPQLRDCVNKIIESGIPVLTVNTDLSGTKRLCYVGCDYAKGGRTAGKLMLMYRDFNPVLLIVTGSLKITGHNERIDGFVTTLARNRMNFNLVSTCESLDDEEHAYKLTLDALQQHPEINCVYITGAGVSGVCRGVSEFGLRDKHLVKVISFDDVPSTRELLRNGEIDFTICQEPHRQGYQAVYSMFNFFLENKKVMPLDCYTETVIKISENI